MQPSLAGPKRPQDRILLGDMKSEFLGQLENLKWPAKKSGGLQTVSDGGAAVAERTAEGVKTTYKEAEFHPTRPRAVVIAAITSCTNTSNPYVMVGAGLLAKNAVEKGLTAKPWVKTSLAPGSKVVTSYLEEAGLMEPLEALNFHLVGYGCTTCIGNSGPLPDPIRDAVRGGELVVASVLSGNRNFEGRISSDVRANYLASPPLVVAYALAGRVDLDLATEPLGEDRDGKPGLPEGRLAEPGGGRRHRPRRPQARDVRARVRRRLRRRRAVEQPRGADRSDLRLAGELDLREAAALLRRSAAGAERDRRHHRRARPRPRRRLDHDRPHLAGPAPSKADSPAG